MIGHFVAFSVSREMAGYLLPKNVSDLCYIYQQCVDHKRSWKNVVEADRTNTNLTEALVASVRRVVVLVLPK
jgi:hypothetical protein